MQLSREDILRMVGGGASSTPQSVVGDVDLTGYATEVWVNENYLSIDFFRSLFKAYTSNNTEVVPNGGDTSVIANIKALHGLWTEEYLSALGLNGAVSGEGGGAVLNEPLETINNAELGLPTVANTSIVWNGTAFVWGNTGMIHKVITAPIEGQIPMLDSQTGSFTFEGDNLIDNHWDWVGLQVGSAKDKWQVTGVTTNGAATMMFRQNDTGGTDSSNWTDWATMLTDKNWKSYVVESRSYRIVTKNGEGVNNLWHRLGHYVSVGDSSNLVIEIFDGDGYNAEPRQNSFARIVIKDGWQSTRAAANSVGVTCERFGNIGPIKVGVVATSDTEGDVWVLLPWNYTNGDYHVTGRWTWTHNDSSDEDTDGTTLDADDNVIPLPVFNQRDTQYFDVLYKQELANTVPLNYYPQYGTYFNDMTYMHCTGVSGAVDESGNTQATVDLKLSWLQALAMTEEYVIGLFTRKINGVDYCVCIAWDRKFNFVGCSPIDNYSCHANDATICEGNLYIAICQGNTNPGVLKVGISELIANCANKEATEAEYIYVVDGGVSGIDYDDETGLFAVIGGGKIRLYDKNFTLKDTVTNSDYRNAVYAKGVVGRITVQGCVYHDGVVECYDWYHQYPDPDSQGSTTVVSTFDITTKALKSVQMVVNSSWTEAEGVCKDPLTGKVWGAMPIHSYNQPSAFTVGYFATDRIAQDIAVKTVETQSHYNAHSGKAVYVDNSHDGYSNGSALMPYKSVGEALVMTIGRITRIEIDLKYTGTDYYCYLLKTSDFPMRVFCSDVRNGKPTLVTSIYARHAALNLYNIKVKSDVTTDANGGYLYVIAQETFSFVENCEFELDASHKTAVCFKAAGKVLFKNSKITVNGGDVNIANKTSSYRAIYRYYGQAYVWLGGTLTIENMAFVVINSKAMGVQLDVDGGLSSNLVLTNSLFCLNNTNVGPLLTLPDATSVTEYNYYGTLAGLSSNNSVFRFFVRSTLTLNSQGVVYSVGPSEYYNKNGVLMSFMNSSLPVISTHSGQQLMPGDSVDAILKSGTYYCTSAANARQLNTGDSDVALPYTSGNFRLWHIVNTGTDDNASQWSAQMLLAPNEPKLFMRGHTSGRFTSWKEFAFTDYGYSKAESDARFVKVEFFNKLFQAFNGSSTVAVNADSIVDGLKIKVGAWTEQYLSALGLNAAISSGGATSLDELSDVTIGTPSNGQVLTWDGTKWVNAAAQTGIDTTQLAAYLTTNGYATQTWVGQQGFLTSQSLSNYVTTNTDQTISGVKTINTLRLGKNRPWRFYFENQTEGNVSTEALHLACDSGSKDFFFTDRNGNNVMRFNAGDESTSPIKNGFIEFPLGFASRNITVRNTDGGSDVYYYLTGSHHQLSFQIGSGNHNRGIYGWDRDPATGNLYNNRWLLYFTETQTDGDCMDENHATFGKRTILNYGSLTVMNSTSISDNEPSQLILSVTQNDNNVTSQGFIRVYDDHDANSNGTNMVIQSSGNMIIGGGESPLNLYSEILTGSTAENLFLTADGSIYFEANANTISSRKGMMLTTAQALVPTIAGVSSNNTGTIGTASYRWNTVYCTQVNIGGVRIYHDGTGLRVEGGLAADTYLSALGVNAATGSGGLDVTALWDELADNGNEQIAANHLTTALSGMVTQVKVGTTAYNPSSGIVTIPAYPTKASWNYDDVYLKLTGGTLSGSVTFNGTGKGLLAQDGTGEYGMLYHNGTNLWIGSKQSTGYHHKGGVYISSGWDASNSKGNSSIFICIPSTNATTGSNTSNSYAVLHEGNYGNYGIFRKVANTKDINFADSNDKNGVIYINKSSSVDNGNTDGFWGDFGSVLNVSHTAANWQLGVDSNNVLKYRSRWWSGGGNDWTDWKTIVFADGNIATATKLQTARTVTLMGDVTGSFSFDGSQAVSFATAIGSGKVTNAMLAGSIANNKLANSQVTVNGSSVSLGGSVTTASWGTARTVTISDYDGTNSATNSGIDGSANFSLKLPATIKATLTGNASSATKLQTARTLWGQSFDGTANVSGPISNATTISASTSLTVGNSYLTGSQFRLGATDYAYHFLMGTGASYVWFDCRDASNTMVNAFQLYPTRTNFSKDVTITGDVGIGTTSPSYKLDVNGTAKATTLRATDIYIGGIHITADNNGIHVNNAGLYTDTYLSALGVNATQSGGGVDAQAVIDILTGTEYQYTLNVAHLPVHDHDSRYYISGGTIHLGSGVITPLTSYTEQYRGTVTQVKVGTTAYSPVNGVVSLPSYLPTTGGAMTGNISYAGTKATYEMIKFIDNTADTYGNGISIGGGGAVVIGGGESSTVMESQLTNGGNESLMLGNDGQVGIYSNLQNGWASRHELLFSAAGQLSVDGGFITEKTYSVSVKGGSGTSGYWRKLGTFTIASTSKNLIIDIYSGNGHNGKAYQNSWAHIVIKSGWMETPQIGTDGINYNVGITCERYGYTSQKIQVRVNVTARDANSSTTGDVYVLLPWDYANGNYIVRGDYTSWVHNTAATTEDTTTTPPHNQGEVGYFDNAYLTSTVANATNADLLDGKHSTDFVTRAGFFRNSNTSATVTPSEIILPLTNAAYDIWELDLSGASVSYATSAGSAGTATTATTASKLSTVSKTIWGQTYWTSGGVPDNVDGKMTINYTGSSASELITLKAPNASYNCISYNKVGTNGLNWSVGINASSYYFWNSSNGTVVSIANAGNLGVGTTNPGYKLDVNGTGRFVSGVISNNSIQSDGDLYMTSQNARILMDYDSVLELNGTSSALMVGYGTTAYSNFTTEIYGGRLDFCTGLTSRMYIDEYGCVGINTYYPQGYTLNVNGTTLLDGLVTANKNIEVLNNGSTASAYVKIGGRKITYDSTNGALFVDGNLYATGGISALGYMQITDAGLAGSLIPTTSNAYDIGSASKSLRKMYSNAVTVLEHLGVGGDAGNNYAMYVNVEDDEGVLLPCWFDCPVTVSGGLNMNTGTVGTAGSSSDTNGTIILTVNGGVKAKKFWLDGSRYLYLDGTTLKYYNGSASKTVVLS